MRAAVGLFALSAVARGEDWDCQEGWVSSKGDSEGSSKSDTLDDCKANCAKKSDCKGVSWNTQHYYCNHITGDFSHSEFKKGLTFKSDHTTCYRGAKQASQLKHDLPEGAWKKFPYGSPAIYTAEDGLPDYNWSVGQLQSESCPGSYRVNCSKPGGKDSDSDFCKCGLPPGHGGNCSECFLMGVLPDAPLTKEFHNTTTTTRRRIIERALGWVTNGFTYDHNDDHKLGAPEGCGSDEKDCPRYDYVSVCQGLVHMAWGGTRLNVTTVDCLKIQPGDHIHRGSHQQLFRRWVDEPGEGKQWVVYQMGGGWGKANAALGTYKSTGTYGVHGCYRRVGIVDE